MRYSNKWAEDVKAAIGNRSQREIAIKMQVSPTTVQNMLAGRIPEENIVVAFSKAVGESAAEWLLKARLAKNELFLRQNNKLSEETVRLLLEIIEEEERKHLSKDEDRFTE